MEHPIRTLILTILSLSAIYTVYKTIPNVPILLKKLNKQQLSIEKLSEKCRNTILKKGKWENFTKHGNWQRYRLENNRLKFMNLSSRVVDRSAVFYRNGNNYQSKNNSIIKR